MTGETPKQTILIIDDHQLILDVVGTFINNSDGMESLTAKSMKEAAQVLENVPTVDLILVDLHMPGQSDVRQIKHFIAAVAPTPVVLFSGDVSHQQVLLAYQLGAKGFLPKDMAAKSMLNALRLLLSGEDFMPAHILGQASSQKLNPVLNDFLDEDEMTVIGLMVEGKSDARIAQHLGHTNHAVHQVVKTIYRKLKVRSRRSAVKLALQS